MKDPSERIPVVGAGQSSHLVTPAHLPAGPDPEPAPPIAPTSRPSVRTRLLAVAEPLALVAVPVALALCALLDVGQGALLTMVVAVVALGVFFVGFESSRPELRQVMPTVVLAALAAAGRVLFAAFADAKPVSALCILAGVVFGRRSGFMVGALAALVSNFFFGQGPWTPWQMYAWGLVGYGAGVLADHGAFRHQAVVYVYGFLSALLYGFVLNSWFVVGFVRPLTWPAALVAYAAGLPLDLVHGVATVAFLLVLYAPWRRKLERIRSKFALVPDRQPAASAER